jgi:chemotaxis protein CheZ
MLRADPAVRQQIEALECDRRELAAIVAAARAALADAAPAALRATTLPNAMSEIAAIAEVAEASAHQIVSCVDDMRSAGDLPPLAYRELVSRNCMQILEACAFQDLTGQRIAKLVSMLLIIEDRLGGLECALGAPFFPAEPLDDHHAPAARGPALPGEGVTQDDIDRLF